MRTRHCLAGALLAGVMHAVIATAQQSTPANTVSALRADPSSASILDSLIQRAIVVNPTLHAAHARVDAARARVQPASALPDPMLRFGLLNQPLGSMPTAAGGIAPAGGPSQMTMRMIGVEQTLPYPGKLALRAKVEERELDATEASLDATRRQIVRDVKGAYYELAFIDQALTIVERNRDVLSSLITVSESRYGVGTGGQQDVLKARVEATRLAETASGLTEQRRAGVAQLNALLDQPSETPVPPCVIPAAIARAAVPASSDAIHFTSTAFGSRAADSPLRPLEELQALAIQGSPQIREHLALLAAQSARVQLAGKAHLPDVDLSLQYGQRGGGLPDMVSATVSFPIPVFKGRKQDQQVAEATAQIAAIEGEHHAMVNSIRADVARLVTEIERERTSLALYVKAILPQSRAALTSATASYQVGKVEFLTVLENQATIFTYETEYFRALTDVATKVAELERIVGTEVLK
ncbi:MAG: TolC family protein [Gemmatimonadota bacterium]|nr:TolC family protein [Gemmatimonadota bacterium]